MSIQIYNDGLAGAGASEAARTQELSRTSAGSKSSSGYTSGGEDQVQISSLSSSLTAQANDRAARLQELASVYQSGQYQVNPTNVSRAIVNQAIQAGAAEGGAE